MQAHATNPAELQRLLAHTRPRERPCRARFRPDAANRATHMHTRHRRTACLLDEQNSAHTSALHLHDRRTCAGLLCSCSGRLTPSCGPVNGRLATSRTGRAVGAMLLGTTPAMLAAADQVPVRIERGLLYLPRPAPGGDSMAARRPRASCGAAREADWRRAHVVGWWPSRADAVADGQGSLSKLLNRRSCARTGWPRRGSHGR